MQHCNNLQYNNLINILTCKIFGKCFQTSCLLRYFLINTVCVKTIAYSCPQKNTFPRLIKTRASTYTYFESISKVDNYGNNNKTKDKVNKTRRDNFVVSVGGVAVAAAKARQHSYGGRVAAETRR